jgi:membrane protease YdiL (CAAX protease family)
MVLLAFCGYKREQYFLAVGESLPRWIAPATGLALIFALTMFVYLQDRSNAVAAARRGVLMPVLLASMNAFAEEVLYRAILLAPILKVLSPYQSVLLTAVVFGIAHYYGTPSGVPGVILTTFAGGVFGYAMVRTRGLLLPWLLHLVPDVVIMLMA